MKNSSAINLLDSIRQENYNELSKSKTRIAYANDPDKSYGLGWFILHNAERHLKYDSIQYPKNWMLESSVSKMYGFKQNKQRITKLILIKETE